MGAAGGPNIVRDGLCFCWDGINHKVWNGSSSSHIELLSRNSGTKGGDNALSITSNHVRWTGGGNRVCTIQFSNSDITVPTGNNGTWLWTQNLSDSGNIDHPNFGKETGSDWDGDDGFVFGTGWGTDGPRWGIADTAHAVYSSVTSTTGDYRTGVWQIYCVTYQRNISDKGIISYLHDSNGQRQINARTSSDVAIGSNTNDLYIGATNSRGGNWNGDMDSVYMWNRTLTATEVYRTMNAIKSKYGL